MAVRGNLATGSKYRPSDPAYQDLYGTPDPVVVQASVIPTVKHTEHVINLR